LGGREILSSILSTVKFWEIFNFWAKEKNRKVFKEKILISIKKTLSLFRFSLTKFLITKIKRGKMAKKKKKR